MCEQKGSAQSREYMHTHGVRHTDRVRAIGEPRSSVGAFILSSLPDAAVANQWVRESLSHMPLDRLLTNYTDTVLCERLCDVPPDPTAKEWWDGPGGVAVRDTASASTILPVDTDETPPESTGGGVLRMCVRRGS